jgi:hypothetical protein
MEINALVESESLLPPKRLGIVCVAMIDSSPHAKARAQACHTCLACVEKTGLSGVGKKGVLSSAKLLSQETTMYRVAALDLMELILSKMNGDMQRLVRICGPNLSDKARLLLEERWYKGQAKETAPLSVSIGSPSRRSQGGSPRKTPMTGSRRDAMEPELYDELPKLSLRARGKEQHRPSPRTQTGTQDTSDDPFAFFSATRRSASPSNMETELLSAGDASNVFRFSVTTDVEPSGAAASLRARLLKIREKGKVLEIGTAGVGEDLVEEDIVANGAEGFETELHLPIDFETHMGSISSLLNKGGPITEKDTDLETCVGSLKIFHAALSRQQHSAVGLTAAQLSDLRIFLIDRMDAMVDLLRRYAKNVELIASIVVIAHSDYVLLRFSFDISRLIGFTINAGDERVNAGMLLPLLSLCLATLMALFRDPEFASKVSPEELTLLIRESGTALLDTRLSSSEELNEDTRTQMVRAINKVRLLDGFRGIRVKYSSDRNHSLRFRSLYKPLLGR